MKTRPGGGGFLGCNNQKFGPLLADSPCKIGIPRSQNRKIFRLRRAFPLVNLTFSGPKPQNFLACGPISPLKSPKSGPGFGPNLEISKSEIWKTRGGFLGRGGGVPGMKYPDGFFRNITLLQCLVERAAHRSLR